MSTFLQNVCSILLVTPRSQLIPAHLCKNCFFWNFLLKWHKKSNKIMVHLRYIKNISRFYVGREREALVTVPSTFSTTDNNKLQILYVGKENETVFFVLTEKYQVKRIIIVKRALISLRCILRNVLKWMLYKSIRNKMLMSTNSYKSNIIIIPYLVPKLVVASS